MQYGYERGAFYVLQNKYIKKKKCRAWYSTVPHRKSTRHGRICVIVESNLPYTDSLRRTSAREQTSENEPNFAYVRLSLIQRVRVALLAR